MYCSSRRKGLCEGVDDHDEFGKQAMEAARSPVHVYAAGDVIYRQGDSCDHVFNLISGWVSLHREAADGRRQIVRFVLPGASFGLELAGAAFNHTAITLTPCRVCPIELSKFDHLRRQIPTLNERLLQLLDSDNRHAIEMLALLGLGRARERVGALMCELAFRAAVATPPQREGVTLGASVVRSRVGEETATAAIRVNRVVQHLREVDAFTLRAGDSVRLPINQIQIAEAVGMTAIHVNRVLRKLREEAIFNFRDRVLTVIDPEKMRKLAESAFEPAALPESSPLPATRRGAALPAFGVWPDRRGAVSGERWAERGR
jgi:CRP-like cAMP-binding protein